MMRPKTYYQALKKSLTKPAYYLEMMTVKFGFTLRFFSLSMILLGILMTVRLNQRYQPRFAAELDQAISEFKSNYPAELRVAWDGEKLTTSNEEAIEVAYPSNFKPQELTQVELPTTLAYLTEENLEPTQFEEKFEKSSWLVISQDQVYLNDTLGNWTVQPLKILLPEAQSISQENLEAMTGEIKSIVLQTADVISKISYLVIPLYLIFSGLWTGLIETLILYLLLRINRIPLKFRQVFQFSLLVIIIAELVNQLSAWLHPELDWPMFTLTFWVVTIYVLWTQRLKLIQLASLNLKNKKT